MANPLIGAWHLQTVEDRLAFFVHVEPAPQELPQKPSGLGHSCPVHVVDARFVASKVDEN